MPVNMWRWGAAQIFLVSASKLESLTFFGVIARFFLLDPMEVGLPVRRHDCCQLRCI
jgi:hypothetical protein